MQKLFFTFPNSQYHQGWDSFEGVSLCCQTGLKFSKEPSLVRFFLWLGCAFLAHQNLGLASFSPSLCSECSQSQCSALLLSAAIQKLLFFRVKSISICVGRKSRQDLSWLGNGGNSECLGVLLFVDTHGHESARNVPWARSPVPDGMVGARKEWQMCQGMSLDKNTLAKDLALLLLSHTHRGMKCRCPSHLRTVFPELHFREQSLHSGGGH